MFDRNFGKGNKRTFNPFTLRRNSRWLQDLEDEEVKAHVTGNLKLNSNTAVPQPVTPPTQSQSGLPSTETKTPWEAVFGDTGKRTGVGVGWDTAQRRLNRLFNPVAEIGAQAVEESVVGNIAKGLFHTAATPIITPFTEKDALDHYGEALDPRNIDFSNPILPSLNTPKTVEEYKALDREHEQRPITEKLGYGVVFDPTVLVGGGVAKRGVQYGKFFADSPVKVYRGVRAGLTETAVSHETAVARVHDEAHRVIPRLSTKDEIITAHNPSYATDIPGAREVIRQISPTEDLFKLDPTSTEAIARTGLLVQANTTREINNYLVDIRATLNSIGQSGKVFGRVDNSIQPPTRNWQQQMSDSLKRYGYDKPNKGVVAFSIRFDSADNLINPPLLSEVIEHPEAYRLTNFERKWVDSYGKVTDDLRKYGNDMGLEIEDIRGKKGITNYLPRWNRDARGDFQLSTDNIASADPIHGNRLRDAITLEMYEAGNDYLPAYDSVVAYAKDVYSNVQSKMLYNILEPLSHNQDVPLEIAEALRLANTNVGNGKLAIETLENVLSRDSNIIRKDWNLLARAYPNHLNAIQDLKQLKMQDMQTVISRISRNVFNEAKVTPEKFWDTISRRLPQTVAKDKLSETRFINQIKNTWHGSHSFEAGASKAGDVAVAAAKAMVKKGYTLDELKRLEIDAYKAATGHNRNPGRTVATQIATQTDEVNLINDTLKQLRNEGQFNARLITAFEQASNGVLNEKRKNMVALLINDFRTDFDQFKTLAREAQLDMDKATHTINDRQITEARLSFLPDDLLFDKADAAVIEKVLGKENRLEFPTGKGLENRITLKKEFSQALGGVAYLGNSASIALRWSKTGFDFGTPFIQLLYTLFSKPEEWGKAVTIAFRTLKDKSVVHDVVYNHRSTIREMTKYGVALRSSDFAHAIDQVGAVADKAVQKFNRLPSVVKMGAKVPVEAASLLYRANVTAGHFHETAIDTAKIFWWEALAPTMKKEKDFLELGSFINKVTGTLPGGILGVSRTQSHLESAAFAFSPGFTRATAALYANIANKGMKGELAKEATGKLLWGHLLMVGAVTAVVGGNYDNLQPIKDGKYNSRLLQVTIPGTNNILIPGSQGVRVIKSLSKLLAVAFKNPDEDITWKDINDPIFRHWRGGAPPAVAVLSDLVSGQNYLGQIVPNQNPNDILKYAGRQALPFSMDSAIETWSMEVPDRNKGLETGSAALLEFYGVSNFTVPVNRRYDEQREELIQEKFGISWEELRKQDSSRASIEESILLSENENLAALGQSRANLRLKSSKFKQREEYERGVDAAWFDFAKTVNMEGQSFEDGWVEDDQSGRAFGRKIADARAELNGKLEGLETQYATVVEETAAFFDKQKDKSKIAQATDEFISALESPAGTDPEIITGVLNVDGSPNPILIKQLRRQVDEDWGKGTIDRISKTFLSSRKSRWQNSTRSAIEYHPAVLQRWESYIKLSDYWGAYEDVVPKDLWVEFEAWDSLSPDEQRARSYDPSFNYMARLSNQVELERIRMRQKDKDVDYLVWRTTGKKPVNAQNSKEFREHLYFPLKKLDNVK